MYLYYIFFHFFFSLLIIFRNHCRNTPNSKTINPSKYFIFKCISFRTSIRNIFKNNRYQNENRRICFFRNLWMKNTQLQQTTNKTQQQLNYNNNTKKTPRIKTFWMYTTILSEIYSIYEPPRFPPSKCFYYLTIILFNYSKYIFMYKYIFNSIRLHFTCATKPKKNWKPKLNFRQ